MSFLWGLYRNLWPSLRRLSLKHGSADSNDASTSEPPFASLESSLARTAKENARHGVSPLKMTEGLIALTQQKCKASAVGQGAYKDQLSETRIEIDIEAPLKGETRKGATVVDSAADMPEHRRCNPAPETIRVRDLKMDGVQIFTPVTPATTQCAQTSATGTSTAQSDALREATEEEFVPLTDLYDAADGYKTIDCGCTALDPKEILCGKWLIGRGVSSQVYKGRYRGQDVVLKFIISCKDANFEKEFRRECTTFQKIPPHENIITMYGVVGTCIVLEYCNLGSLFDLIHDPSYPMPLSTVRQMLCDIAASLIHLHSRKMIHRDLKPGNLLVTRTERRDVVKLADFGLARNYLRNSTMTVGIGTWQYSSPEFFTDSKLTAKSDVYAFGVVMWEMCTRRQPYVNTQMHEIYASIAKGEDYRLPVPPEMDSELGRLYEQCTSRDPHERPTFEEMLSSIQPDINGVKEME